MRSKITKIEWQIYGSGSCNSMNLQSDEILGIFKSDSNSSLIFDVMFSLNQLKFIRTNLMKFQYNLFILNTINSKL